jgi:transposase
MNQGTRIGSMAESLAKEARTGREFRDVEGSAVSQRRRFTAAYTCRVVAEADACTEPGQVGALWRREGWYSSPLTTWRRPCEHGMVEALTPNKRGRKARGLDPLAQRVAQLERDQARLSQHLKQAETIIEGHKKVSELWGRSHEGSPPGGSLSWQPRGDERRTWAPGRLVRHWACRAPVTIVTSHAWSARVARASGRHRRSP